MSFRAAGRGVVPRLHHAGRFRDGKTFGPDGPGGRASNARRCILSMRFGDTVAVINAPFLAVTIFGMEHICLAVIGDVQYY